MSNDFVQEYIENPTNPEYNNILSEFKKGAEIARNPGRWNAVEGLTEDQRSALNDEEHHPFRQPMKLWLTIICCSFGALVQYVLENGALFKA